jgi:sRNA-binding protein
LQDLKDDGAGDVLLAAASFYMRNWNYQSCLQAGSERVDLNGKKAGVVTKQEELTTQKHLQEDKAAAAKRQEEQVRNHPLPQEAAAIQPPTIVRKPTKVANPKFARLRTLLGAVDDVKTDDQALQEAMTVAALKLLVKEAQKVISELETGEAAE